MNTISASNISKSFPAKKVFENISLTINQGDRIAVIGENGIGKSTLMKILCGIESPDEGKIQCDNWIDRRYSAQEPTFNKTKTLLEIIADLANPDECLRNMSKLGFKVSDKDISEMKVQSLSGGQQKILDLACQISSSPDFLFIDEPENHLDIIARRELGKIVKKYWGAVVFVSHDRHFINEVATKIIEIEDWQTRVVTGTYEEYIAQREIEIEAEARHWKSEKKDIQRLENAVRILQLRARFNTKGSGVYQSRKRELEKRKSNLGEKPATERGRIKLQSNDIDRKNGKRIVVCENLSFRYGNSTPFLFTNVNLGLQFGERVALVGRNGTGKSTLVNILRGIIQPNRGICKLGNDINVQYFDQMSTFDNKSTALKIVESAMSCHEGIARSLLAKILFNQHEVTLPLHRLSGGQRNRIRIALLFAKNPEFIVLDEPTNNLDPTTWDVLVDQIQDYKGTLLIISHDQSFLENINMDKFWVFKNRSIIEDLRDLSKILAEL
ncbi:MAG TPA: ABC-F family ATP-binding cassette domain-containing protein [Candidatus Moranbacteria bacterium]|nr:ABC-F family ATP-binding cassette domain-containing protein [Candidatus Moranbacteria bacterium]HSA08419.1 ABC-F family ATP-binding cassette domain-containing protein [Candidatus Moranbacteria bacterium]